MKVKSFKGGFDNNFCYLIWCEDTMQAAIIDPSIEPLDIFKFIEQSNIVLSKILITHTHYDHICCLSDFLPKYPDTKIYAYAKTRQSFNNNFLGINHNDTISVGASVLNVLYTPGHYDDCLCYWNMKDKMLFTGDTVFVGRAGRTINQYSNISNLYKSIYNIILKLPGDTVIYPGHDYGDKPQITITDNIKSSSFFSSKSEEEFITVMNRFEKNRR